MLTKTCRDGRVQFGAVCGAAAVAYLAIGLARHELGFAITGFVIMIAYGTLLLALHKKGEPLALLSGHLTDERQAQVVQRAMAATAQVLVIVLVVGAMITLAIGSRYSGVFSGLAAVGGVTFVLTTIWYSRRG